MSETTLTQEAVNLNGSRIIARTKEAIYIRLPKSAWRPSSDDPRDKCSCGHCDGSGMYDTLCVPTSPAKKHDDYCHMIHMPDSSVPPFMEYMKRKGLA